MNERKTGFPMVSFRLALILLTGAVASIGFVRASSLADEEPLPAAQTPAAGALDALSVPLEVAQETRNYGGFYAFRKTRTQQNEDGELKRIAEGFFERVPGSGETWDDVCEAAEPYDHLVPPLHCRMVVDWEGRKHFSCSDRNTYDGTRMALCTINLRSGFYGYVKTRTPKNEEPRLRRLAKGRLTRIVGPAGPPPNTFKGLCESVGLSCEYVVDWEGTRKYCSADARDGSRMAYCGS